MLHLITDAKNFVYGTVHETITRAARWGSWAVGYRGESMNENFQDQWGVPTQQQSWSTVHVGGMLAVAVAIGAATGNAVLGFAIWGAGIAAATAAGAITGFLTGGISEVARGYEVRAYKDELYQQQQLQAQSQGMMQAADIPGLMSGKSHVEQLQQQAETGRGLS